MSCNGCRVLRRGCIEGCVLRTCLSWIETPNRQANATLFLAKYYGRAGLMNLINAAPPEHHEEVFRSLLTEACGRIIDPVNGAVGLMMTGKSRWINLAVESVFNGAPLMKVPKAPGQVQYVPFRGCDIRRLLSAAAIANDPPGGIGRYRPHHILHRSKRARAIPPRRFRMIINNNGGAGAGNDEQQKLQNVGGDVGGPMRRARSMESSSGPSFELLLATVAPITGQDGQGHSGLKPDLTLSLKTGN